MKPKRQSRKVSARTGQNPAARIRQRDPQWAVFCYLAGDLKSTLAQGVRSDLKEILDANSTDEVVIAAQYDGPDGAVRYVLPRKRSPKLEPKQKLGPINSGASSTLADFLRWALTTCPAKRVALMLGGVNALDPCQERAESGSRASRVFTICRDDSCGGYMDVVDVGAVIHEVLAEFGRENINLFAVDSCHTQFLELAYELEGKVQVMIASQTSVPGSGWNYTAVLRAFTEAVARAAQTPDSRTVATAILPSINESYRSAKLNEPCVVSALDLRQLDDVARAFDNFCIGLMQVLGEGLIWETRKLLLELFDQPEKSGQPDTYDCGSFFMLMGAALDAMADEAYQGWLGTTLQRDSGPGFDQFREVVARRFEELRRAMDNDYRSPQILAALRAPDAVVAGGELLKQIGQSVKHRLELFTASSVTRGQLQNEVRLARVPDRWLQQAMEESIRLLPQERRINLDRLSESVDSAKRLARQARHAAVTLLGTQITERFDSANEQWDESRTGIVFALESAKAQPTVWPRWSGVSIYRPRRLDALMSTSYQRFAFHQRVHWAAMLGAANLIEYHPRALWRLVSSLLATGSAGTRRDLLRRLTGPDSVAWGLREQFRVMAPAPTLTLSLEKRRGALDLDEPESKDAATREHYVLRLESVNSGAVITEQRSRIQPKATERALQELEGLLMTDVATPALMRRLRAIGGLLGEDVLQGLGRGLEEERQAVLDGAAKVSVHLQLQIPRELMRYPWELLHHRGEWMSERFAIGRQVFMQTGLARRVPRRRQGRVRPLIIGDPLFDEELGWNQLPGARAEAEQVAGWFERVKSELGAVIDFEFDRDTRIHTRLTTAEFRDLIRSGDYDIIHFAGHGVFNGRDPETSSWLLSDGQLWALELRNTLMDHHAPPWLVYANACEAGMESDRPSRSYQGNVFGLATAFINQGVAAYIAPLWPIDDMLAQHIALQFYRNLLCERATLGEALRRAKSDARKVTYPDQRNNDLPPDSMWAGLGWASLVLYGDPTEELFQALAGTSRAEPEMPPAPSSTPTPVPGAARRFLHAPDHLMVEWASGPGMRPSPVRRGEPMEEGAVLELVEDAGLRHWRWTKGAAAAAGNGGKRGGAGAGSLPGSPIAAVLANDAARQQLPGNRGLVRVIGRWVLSGFGDGITGLVREYDREQVAEEGLLFIPSQDVQSMMPIATWLEKKSFKPKSSDRLLVLIHGTFSNTASPVEGLGSGFLKWAREHYQAVLGLDHWTLSKTPLDNARMLYEQLRTISPQLLEGRRLDMITHSRGGLVGRAFCELLGGAPAVKNLIFLGTPNCGTDLANPKNWGALADVLVNLTGLDHAELLGRLAALLARLSVEGTEAKIPGLLAQNPLMAGVNDSFLNLLQKADAASGGVRHAVITAEFEPLPLVPNLKKLLKAAVGAGVDAVMDKFFQSANDLVVNTTHTWCIGQPPVANEESPSALPSFLPSNRVLIFRPPGSKLEPPLGVEPEQGLGIHHCNLFGQERAQECMKRWLTES